MKDTQVKPSPTPPLLPKSKLGIKKEKMAAKKLKEHKTPIMKVGKTKKLSNIDKKLKVNKDNVEPIIKRKRGRPRNEDRLLIKKPVKEQKSDKKGDETKTVGRKRKLILNADGKHDKDSVSPPSKKSRMSDGNCNVNGDIKMPPAAFHKPLIQKGESPTAVELTASNAVNSNGALPCKKSIAFGQKKPVSILKSATFHPPAKKELLNGNNSLASFKVNSIKNKSSFKKDPEVNSFSKEPESSKTEKVNSVSSLPKDVQKESAINELGKLHSKESVKLNSKEPSKAQTKELVKQTGKEAVKNQVKDPVRTQPKETAKSSQKDTLKTPLKEPPPKSQPKEQNRSQPKEQIKQPTKDAVKPQPKEHIKFPQKDSSKPQPKDQPTKPPVKEPAKSQAKPKEPPREPVKSHPQRMASLDAMARMHVICTTDRRPPEPKHTSVSVCPRPVTQKSITQCHERIQFDLKKETNDFKGNIVHKQEINYVKEKQQVFVSHSVEQSSVVEREQSNTVSTEVQHEPEKKKKVKSLEKTGTSNKQLPKNKMKQAPSSHLKLADNTSKTEKNKSKPVKIKEVEKKSAKAPNKTVSKLAKTVKEKPDVKSSCKKTKKVEQTKSEVKVKETIRMQKTCTYQSVTTVNSHGTANSSVVPVSHVGMTTNFSKTKKTVVTDEECKNKVNYSAGSVVNNSYCLTTESPCAVGPHTDCCKFHAHPQIIPVAHVQTCSLGHSLGRTSDASPSPSHCDGSFSVHRFGHQQPVIFTPPPPPPAPAECGCCCPNSLVQNVRDACLLRKSLVAYPHHLPSHHTHLPTAAFSNETLCSDYHPNSATLDPQRHHAQHYTISSPSTHSRVACCACCELHRETNQHHHQTSLQYVSQPKTSSSLVPCEQTPLDLSLTSTTSNINIESDIPIPQGHCSSTLCCSRDLLLLRTTPHGFQHNKFSSNKPCCRCSKQIVCETQAVDSVQSLSCSNKSIIKIDQPQTVDRVSLLTSPVGQGSVPPVASTSGITNKSVPHVITEDSLVTAKCEKSISPKQSSKPSLVPKKRVFAHGWSWNGKPREKLIALTNDSVPCPRICYPSVQHKEGDTINERDCVLLRSGPKDTDLPYVAKVAAFWENPEDGEMMMSLLWYYRPEHTDQGRKPGQCEDEVFASRHKDVNSVACIEDKCYVLTYNEYCRYKASLSMDDDMTAMSSVLVPDLPDGYPRKSRLPNEVVSQDIVFFCRHVYDFRQKRILKNPT